IEHRNRSIRRVVGGARYRHAGERQFAVSFRVVRGVLGESEEEKVASQRVGVIALGSRPRQLCNAEYPQQIVDSRDTAGAHVPDAPLLALEVVDARVLESPVQVPFMHQYLGPEWQVPADHIGAIEMVEAFRAFAS